MWRVVVGFAVITWVGACNHHGSGPPDDTGGIPPASVIDYGKASNTGMGDGFGASVSLSGDTLAVGAPGESSAATGVNGNQADNTASSAGAVYMFR